MNTETSGPKPKTSFFTQKKLYFKIMFIMFLILLLMIPNAFISDLIYERSSLRQSTQNEISSTWGGEQLLGGLVLVIPYESQYINKDEEIFTTDHKLYIAPNDLKLHTAVKTQERKKSIYSTTLFATENDIDSNILVPSDKVFPDNIPIYTNEKTCFYYRISDGYFRR